MATIITKNSSTASSVPLAAQLVQGELAVNVTDKRLFTENNGGTVVELGTNPSSLSTGALAYTGTLTGGTGVVNIGSGQVYKDASGNLGVGTSLPQAKLQVAGASNATVLKVSSTDQTSGMLSLGDGSSTTNNVGVYRGAAAAVSAGNWLNLGGYDGIAFTTGSVALGSQSEKARIDSSGNLLVGTTSIAGPGLTTIVAGLYRTLSGNGTANNATSTTLFSISANTAYFVTVQTGNASGISSTALVHYVSGGNPVVKTNIAQDTANFTITISGTNVQVTNNLGGVINYSFSALRVG